MDNKSNITEFHIDVLKEIGNIGAGNAATALSNLIGKPIDMKVPTVKIVTFDEMIELAGGYENIVTAVFLRVEGDISGSMFVVLPLEQATKYVQTLTGDTAFSFENPPYSEIGLSSMQELGNILAGSYLTALSDFTSLNLMPSIPSLNVDMAGAIISSGIIELSQTQDYAIVIDTALREEIKEVSNTVKGHFFLLPDPDSFNHIFRSLGVEI